MNICWLTERNKLSSIKVNSKLTDNIKSLPFVRTVKTVSDELDVEVYLVGGIVRDMIIEEAGGLESGVGSLDIDFDSDLRPRL